MANRRSPLSAEASAASGGDGVEALFVEVIGTQIASGDPLHREQYGVDIGEFTPLDGQSQHLRASQVRPLPWRFSFDCGCANMVCKRPDVFSKRLVFTRRTSPVGLQARSNWGLWLWVVSWSQGTCHDDGAQQRTMWRCTSRRTLSGLSIFPKSHVE